MNEEPHTILFTLVYKGEAYAVETKPTQYHTLMALITDYLAIPPFGLCSGMGSCGTCMVALKNSHSTASIHTLSCGIHINNELANATVIIPDSFY